MTSPQSDNAVSLGGGFKCWRHRPSGEDILPNGTTFTHERPRVRALGEQVNTGATSEGIHVSTQFEWNGWW